MGEQREGVAELVAVERPLRLPHDDGIEAAVGIGQCREERAGLGPPLGRDGAGLVDVEELGDDLPPRGSIRFLARVICQAREDSGSWLSSVDTRPQNASRMALVCHGHSLLLGVRLHLGPWRRRAGSGAAPGQLPG